MFLAVQIYKVREDAFDPYDSWISFAFIANRSFPSQPVNEKKGALHKGIC